MVRPMRTTIEITDEQRAKLLELAARRGEKGFSILVQEALDLYLREQGRLAAARRSAGDLMGVWSDVVAEEALDRIRGARARRR